MENGGCRSFDIVVYNLILFYHSYIWDSIEIIRNHHKCITFDPEKTSRRPDCFCIMPSSV